MKLIVFLQPDRAETRPPEDILKWYSPLSSLEMVTGRRFDTTIRRGAAGGKGGETLVQHLCWARLRLRGPEGLKATFGERPGRPLPAFTRRKTHTVGHEGSMIEIDETTRCKDGLRDRVRGRGRARGRLAKARLAVPRPRVATDVIEEACPAFLTVTS